MGIHKGGIIMAEVRLIAELFDNFNFLGFRRTVIENLDNFGIIEFDNRTTSVIVSRGPDFQPGDAVRLWTERNFSGRSLTLPPGQYNDLRTFNFNDQASSLQIVNTGVPEVIAEDRQRETIRFELEIITPPGTSLVSVVENRISNPTASGVFLGNTGVRVTGSFIDEIVVRIRDIDGVIRQATGRTTIRFVKDLNFPVLAGMDKTNLGIRVFITGVASSFTLTGNILQKTVSFDLTTRIVRT